MLVNLNFFLEPQEVAAEIISHCFTAYKSSEDPLEPPLAAVLTISSSHEIVNIVILSATATISSKSLESMSLSMIITEIFGNLAQITENHRLLRGPVHTGKEGNSSLNA